MREKNVAMALLGERKWLQKMQRCIDENQQLKGLLAICLGSPRRAIGTFVHLEYYRVDRSESLDINGSQVRSLSAVRNTTV